MQIDTRAEAMLRRENNDLRQQLREAQCTITTLRSELEILRKHLSKYQGHGTDDEHIKSPEMQIEQRFENSSQSSSQQESLIEYSSNIKLRSSPLSHSSTISNRYHQHAIHPHKYQEDTENNEDSILKVINEDENTYKIKEINRKCSQRKYDDENTRNDSPLKSASTRDIQISKISLFNKDFSCAKSQKQLFRKTSNSKPIFDCFFVTGITKDGPCITYSYPHGTGHNFEAYLSLMYGQNSLRQPDLSPNGSKNKLNINNILQENPFSIYIRDTFVIPIIKPQSMSTDKDFLVICEVQQSVIEKEYAGWHFPRYYCFLSQWKFFNEFRKLISQLIDRIHIKKKLYPQLNEAIFTTIIQEEIENGISFLHRTTTDYNKTLDCRIGESGLKFTVDIPPQALSYQLIEKYQQWEIINSMVQFRMDQDENPQKETELFGVLIVYALAEAKIVLYSSVKSKISEAILQLLEIIRPLTYVNPIMMATLKDDYENYLDAPMSIILGLWAEQKKSSRQKIQIFMNKKLNLMGLIEKAMLKVPDGIVINLDTGLIFGGGISNELNELALKINLYRRKFTKSRQTYKMIEKMMMGRFDSEQSEQIWHYLRKHIQKTQNYCYYLQNKEE